MNRSAKTRVASQPSMQNNHVGQHSFEPRDPLEVDTPHGPGFVLYITVYGVHGNDMWCVANKADGRLRHYETTQLQMVFNGALGLARPAVDGVVHGNGNGNGNGRAHH